MRQGNSYEEEAVEMMGGSGPKIPKKALIAGGVVLAVGLIAVGIFAFMSREAKPSEEDLPEISIDIDAIEQELSSYTEDEIRGLRAAGYTGDEIEKYQESFVSVEELMVSARKLQQEFMQESYVELRDGVMNSASEDYKNLLNMTWLGGNVVEVGPLEGKTIYDYQTEQLRANVNYVKIPSRGYQTMLKLDFPDGEVFFMNIHPTRYYVLAEKGNIVISYDKIVFGDDVYFSNVVEVPIN